MPYLMRILNWFSVAICAAGLCSCASQEREQPQLKDSLFLNDSTAFFRGHSIGDRPAEVRQREQHHFLFDSDSLMEISDTLLWQNAPLPVTYFLTFDEFGLFEIQVDAYPPNFSAADSLTYLMASRLNERYGKAEQVGIAQRFTSYSESNHTVEITLSNESADRGEPFVSLNYLEPLEDEL